MLLPVLGCFQQWQIIFDYIYCWIGYDFADICFFFLIWQTSADVKWRKIDNWTTKQSQKVQVEYSIVIRNHWTRIYHANISHLTDRKRMMLNEKKNNAISIDTTVECTGYWLAVSISHTAHCSRVYEYIHIRKQQHCDTMLHSHRLALTRYSHQPRRVVTRNEFDVKYTLENQVFLFKQYYVILKKSFTRQCFSNSSSNKTMAPI